MKTLQILMLSLVAGCLAVSAQTDVRVIGDRVNMRAKPLLTSEVVTQAAYDEQLKAYEIGDEWVEVLPPASADFWITKKYVRPDNTIGANRVNVRAGPSINYNIVATLSLGDSVEPRGEEIRDWIKIAPPPSSRLWIHRDFVEILTEMPPKAQKAEKSAKKSKKSSKKAKKSEKTTDFAQQEGPEALLSDANAPEAQPEAIEKDQEAMEDVRDNLIAAMPTPLVSPSTPVPDDHTGQIPVPPPADLQLIPLEGQGRVIEVEGELRAAPLINEAPARYRVVVWQKNRWQILCHVYGKAATLRRMQDKRVHIKGRQYWIKDAAAPVLIPDQIREIPSAD